jgi:very-short-patch-repair endonuclease
VSKINEAYVIDQYVNKNRSANDIAKEVGTYPKKISRIVAKNGHQLRNRSETQKLALEQGTASHPTAGKKRTEQEKKNISLGISDRWSKLSKKQKEAISQSAKERWESKSELEKQELKSAAARGIRLAGVEGSKAEKFLRRRLLEENYDVLLHKKDLIPGDYEIDIFLPALKIVIEIDGRHHFEPVWGEERLKKVIEYDAKKNGLLMSKGYSVIRIKYLCNKMTRAVGEKMWAKIKPMIDNISTHKSKQNRLVEIEVSLEN